MNIVRFKDEKDDIRIGVINDEKLYPLPFNSIVNLFEEAKDRNVKPFELIQNILKEENPPSREVEKVTLCTPIEISEVWASGVTYQKSREARNYEATDGELNANTFYDKVYDAERPEIFFKATGRRTIGPNDSVYLRSDSNWQVPEPELGVVINKEGEILGYTIGNDMSCRDIEGENPLYLPQAKIWKNSCSIGPTIRLAETVENPYDFNIICRIFRDKKKVFEDEAKVDRLKRTIDDLVDYLKKDNDIFDGTILLTGTCIVPPNDFTLQQDDIIEIEIPGIGVLSNPVKHPNMSASK